MKSQHPSSQLDLVIFEGYQPAPKEARWVRIWRRVMEALSFEQVWTHLAKLAYGQSEPIIEKRCDRQGYTFYVAYDPKTDQRGIFTSEAELRAWIEQRYYQ